MLKSWSGTGSGVGCDLVITAALGYWILSVGSGGGVVVGVVDW